MLEWVQVQEIKGEDGHAVRIQRRGDQRPQYSYQIGRERRPEPDGTMLNDRLLPFVTVRLEGPTANRASEKMVQQALEWIERDAVNFAASAPPPRSFSRDREREPPPYMEEPPRGGRREDRGRKQRR